MKKALGSKSLGIASCSLVIAIASLLWTLIPYHSNSKNANTTLTSFGAKCDGVSDDTDALQRWLDNARFGQHMYAPSGTCLFSRTLYLNGSNIVISGSGLYQTTFSYIGNDNSTDLLTIGNFNEDTRNVELSEFRVTTRKRMLSGTAVHLKRLVRSILRNIVIDGQDGEGLLWNGIWFDQIDQVSYHGFDIRCQHDALRVNGSNAEDGPKAGLMIEQGKIVRSKVGLHVGGAFGGLYADQVDIIANGTNVIIDTILSEQGNREIFLGPEVSLDSPQNGPAIEIDDMLANKAAWLGLTGTWLASGSQDGILIRPMVNWIVSIEAGTVFNFKGDGIHNDSRSATVIVNGTVIRNNGGSGIWTINKDVFPTNGFSPIFIHNGRDYSADSQAK